MSSAQFYSDRTGGATPRIQEILQPNTSASLLSLIESKVSSNWLARAFPYRCEDGGSSVAGTDVGALSRNLQGLIPGIEWPLNTGGALPDKTVFDLIEFAANRIALPVEGRWHSYWNHYELSFDEKQGRQEFCDEVNLLLSRGGTVFQLAGNLQIERLGTPIVRDVLAELRSNSGDAELDALITEALARYRSRHEGDRVLALEKIWDAFERLKTVEIPSGDKKASIAALLAHISDAAARDLVESEVRALTDVGNQFMIRHHETGKHPVPAEMRDYLFARMGGLVILLLRESKRLG